MASRSAILERLWHEQPAKMADGRLVGLCRALRGWRADLDALMSWSPRPDRHPHDWYVEQAWVTEALLDAPEFCDDDLGAWHGYDCYLDPACGMGTIPKVLEARHYDVEGCDVVDRGYPGTLVLDFLNPNIEWSDQCFWAGRLSIISNPPYSCQLNILEDYIKVALGLATNRVAFLVPLGRLAGVERFSLYHGHKPLAVCILMERPSMPRGDLVEALGAKAWRRGRMDFCWIVWDVNQPEAKTRTIFLEPRPAHIRDPRRKVAA